MTLDDLTEQLREFNMTLSRSAVYLRLLPRDASTNEGKKHHKSLPVKLLRPQNSAHFLKVPEGQLKPILVVTVDGGPDENPRFAKTLAAWASHFRAYDLDALFVASYAPGQSAFHLVERRMAPLSHDLSGLILRHDRWVLI